MLLLSTRITEALNKGHKSYYALPFLAYSFSIQRQYSTYTKLFCYLPLFLEVNSGTAYPFVISRNSVWKNALNFQNYVSLTSVNPIFDVKPIDAEIYTRKLLFFGRLCQLSSNTLAKKIFLKRLYSFLYDLARTQFGHSRNFANSSLVRTRELLAKLATGRIIPRQTGLEENFHDLGIIATNYNVRVVKLATLTSTFFRSIFGNTEPSIIWKNVPKLLWN